MAATENQPAPFSDSDSDDEFFDALVNEESTCDRLENKTPLVNGSGDPNNLQSVQKCTSSTAETAKKSTGDGQPEPEGNVDVRSLSKTEPNLQETCGNIPERLSDNIKVSNPEGGDASSTECTLDNNGIESEQGMFLDASSHQPLFGGDQENKLTDDDAFEGLEVEENEDDNLQEAGENKEEEEEVVVDEENMRREREDAMTEEEREKLKEDAQTHKARGNDLFKQDEFLDAVSAYTQALELCPLCYQKERSIMYANRAACRVRKEQNEMAVQDCNKALQLHPHYLKVWLRRANTYELMEKLDEAMADFKQVLELDPSCYEARAACMRLPNQIKERNEKLKEEMFGKLKDLGNLVLRPFGLSTNNFQMQQDPNTGSYSMNFSQNPTSGNGKP